MIISMRPHATREEIEHVCDRIREFGYKVHSIEYIGNTKILIKIKNLFPGFVAIIKSFITKHPDSLRRVQFLGIQKNHKLSKNNR